MAFKIDENHTWGELKKDSPFGFNFGSGTSEWGSYPTRENIKNNFHSEIKRDDNSEFSSVINTEFIEKENGKVISNNTNIYKLGSPDHLDKSRFEDIMKQVIASLKAGEIYVLDSARKEKKTSQGKSKKTVTVNVQFTYTL